VGVLAGLNGVIMGIYATIASRCDFVLFLFEKNMRRNSFYFKAPDTLAGFDLTTSPRWRAETLPVD
jgi:hypothetical protein